MLLTLGKKHTSFSSLLPFVRTRRPEIYSSKDTWLVLETLKALKTKSVKTVSLTKPRRPKDSLNSNLDSYENQQTIAYGFK